MAPSNVSELFEFARQSAYDAAQDVLCGLGSTQRISLDVASKVNPLFRGSALEDFFRRQQKALQSFCPVPPSEAPSLQPTGFAGGQCDVPYRIDYQFFFTNEQGQKVLSPSQPQQLIRTGPLSLEVISDSIGSNRGFRLNHAGGQTTLANGFTPDSAIGQEVFSVERVDGLPDDCGDSPPSPPTPGPDDPPPTDPRPTVPDVTINLPDIGPVVVAFAPVVGIIYADVDARIKIPVRVNVNIPEINLNFDVDFNIDVSDPSADPEPIPTDPDRDDDDRPVLPDCPLPPDCTDEPEEDEPGSEDEDDKDSKGSEIVAAVVLAVRNSDASRASEIFQATAPSIIAPSVGHINFVYERPDGSEVFSSDIRVKNTNTVIPAPYTGLKVKRVVGTPNQGYDWEIFQISSRSKCGG